MRVGTAVGSNDLKMIPFLKSLRDRKLINYIDLYIREDATMKELIEWRKTGLVSMCQAPHTDDAGLDYDFLQIGIEGGNLLQTTNIVFNAGVDGRLPNLEALPMNCVPENMPYYTADGKKGVYSLPEEIESDFCLDIAHSWITAHHLKRDPKELFLAFMKKKPVHLHITDSHEFRDHLSLGVGSMDFDFIMQIIKDEPRVTVETDNLIDDREKSIEQDLLFLHKYL